MDAKEKEMVAFRLVSMVGRASAANILGITVRELDKLVEICTSFRRRLPISPNREPPSPGSARIGKESQ